MLKLPNRSDYLLFGGVFVLANKLQAVADKTVDGLSTKQWFLIRTILDLPSEPPPTITQIVREMDSTRQNITKMLEKVARDGLIVIEDNESDHRSRRVRVTEKGRNHVRRVTDNAQEFFPQVFDGIDQAELDTSGKVVLKMLKNLSNMQAEFKEEKRDE